MLLISCCLVPSYTIYYIFAPYPAPIVEHKHILTSLNGMRPGFWVLVVQESSDEVTDFGQWYEARGYSSVSHSYARCLCLAWPHVCLNSASLISPRSTTLTELRTYYEFEYRSAWAACSWSLLPP